MTPDEDFLNQLKFSLSLTDYEAKSYMALMETGPLSVAEVSNKSGVPRPKCYEVLNSLLSKGLVSRTMSKPMKYQPLPIEMAFAKRLAQMKDDLEKRARDADDVKTKISKMEWQHPKSRTYKVIFIEDPESLFSFMVNDTEGATTSRHSFVQGCEAPWTDGRLPNHDPILRGCDRLDVRGDAPEAEPFVERDASGRECLQEASDACSVSLSQGRLQQPSSEPFALSTRRYPQYRQIPGLIVNNLL